MWKCGFLHCFSLEEYPCLSKKCLKSTGHNGFSFTNDSMLYCHDSNANGEANIHNSTIHLNIDQRTFHHFNYNRAHYLKNINSYSKANRVQKPKMRQEIFYILDKVKGKKTAMCSSRKYPSPPRWNFNLASYTAINFWGLHHPWNFQSLLWGWGVGRVEEVWIFSGATPSIKCNTTNLCFYCNNSKNNVDYAINFPARGTPPKYLCGYVPPSGVMICNS